MIRSNAEAIAELSRDSQRGVLVLFKKSRD